MKKVISLALTILLSITLSAQPKTGNQKMNFLIHITQGPENPTRAALAFLVARSAVEEGHTVTLFLAGDGVQLFRKEIMDNLTGLGTGKLSEHFDVLVKSGVKFYLSGMSGKVRGISEEQLKDYHAEFAMPIVLVQLATGADRILVY